MRLPTWQRSVSGDIQTILKFGSDKFSDETNTYDTSASQHAFARGTGYTGGNGYYGSREPVFRLKRATFTANSSHRSKLPVPVKLSHLSITETEPERPQYSRRNEKLGHTIRVDLW